MKKHNQPLDDFFRDVLKDHTITPSEPAREAFLKEAATVVNTSKPGKRWFLVLLSGIILVIIGTGIYYGVYSSHETLIPGVKKTSSSVAAPIPSAGKTSNNKISSTIDNEANDTKKILNNSSTHINQSSAHKINQQKNHTSTKSQVKQKTDKPLIAEVFAPASTGNTIPSAPEITPQSVTGKTEQPAEIHAPASGKPAIPDTLNKSPLASPESNTGVSSAPQKKKTKREKPVKDWHITTGVYYAPEWMFNTLEGDKFVNSFGVDGTFHFGNYSIRTGIGVSITKGTNELSVSYNDYLGNYQKLDSMSFKWNSQHSNLVPTYYLSDKNVYDSLMKLDNAKIVKQYTYLQVPLILGYDFWKNERLSIGLRAGPVLSILLQTKQISGAYDPGLNKIITINQVSPERIETNWQLMGGINACLNISRRFGFELEPEVRYYFNSVYEQSDMTKKPWSAGLRVAFHLNY